MLLEFKGGDGSHRVLQANTVMTAPVRAQPPHLDDGELPPRRAARHAHAVKRPGLWSAIQGGVRRRRCGGPSCMASITCPSAPGWLRLDRGEADARRAFEQQSPVCAAVEASGEYDPSEPAERRTTRIERAVTLFRERFGRTPSSLVPARLSLGRSARIRRVAPRHPILRARPSSSAGSRGSGVSPST